MKIHHYIVMFLMGMVLIPSSQADFFYSVKGKIHGFDQQYVQVLERNTLYWIPLELLSPDFRKKVNTPDAQIRARVPASRLLVRPFAKKHADPVPLLQTVQLKVREN